MTQLDNNPAATTQVTSNDLPDLSIYGYQVYEKLSARNDGRQSTYLARDIKFGGGINRLVVIKHWHSPSLDYAHYLPEIAGLQQLDLASVPHYLDSFETLTGFCLVRSYQTGISLAELGELPPSDIRLIADGVLKILDELQQVQPSLIHYNIKPENIIVNTDRELAIYLVDFGLRSDSSQFAISKIPGFLPPNANTNIDIYSLGVSLICLLTNTSTSQVKHLFDANYRPQFRQLLPEDTDLQLIARLEAMLEPKHQQVTNVAKKSRSKSRLAPVESSENSEFHFPEPKKKIRWMRWGLGIAGLFGLGLLAMQFLFPDGDELSPAQIAKNQEIARKAEFAASDRGKLIKDKRCIGCNLNYQNFEKQDLTGVVIPQSSFTGANFASANLTLAIFRDADLSGANLSKANLHQAALYGAKLIGTNLVGANLSKTKLVYAKLQGSWLRDADLSNADLKFAEFQQVDLSNANLTGADLSNADLSYANLLKAKLDGAKLDSTNLTGATMPDGSVHP
jgi:uncharacterized protein YjbI with pentapeptide repeats